MYKSFSIQQAVEAAQVPGHHKNDLEQATFDILAARGLQPQGMKEARRVLEKANLPPVPADWTPQNRMEYEEAAFASIADAGERILKR